MLSSTHSKQAIKRHGVHYTPPELAEFLAKCIQRELSEDINSLQVLDPACGSGQLLQAFANTRRSSTLQSLQLVGFETDSQAIQTTEKNLAKLPTCHVECSQQDFLDENSVNHFNSTENRPTKRLFDVVIANPPYVRTQQLGAARAQKLAKQFKLTGRVDLYQSFAKAIAWSLKPGGIMGLLIPNRFLFTQSGNAMRSLLLTEFQLLAIYDLGDTKLFSASVLPAIVIARKIDFPSTTNCSFDRVYVSRKDDHQQDSIELNNNLLEVLEDREASGEVQTTEGKFCIERGTLSCGKKSSKKNDCWTLLTPEHETWLAQIKSHQSCTFADVGNIKVGIKTTADSIFIRQDWQELPDELQPEKELLSPLITHHEAHRWKLDFNTESKQVLYPYQQACNKRTPIHLEDYPQAKAYLAQYQQQLSQRTYLIQANRKWFEIWVPHQPSQWMQPKLVFPDIAEQPRFSIDKSGAIVNGDCYWITLKENISFDWLLIMLAVGNSTLITKFYDVMFHNKLYAGRRRFMTQYVNQFPLPKLESSPVQQLLKLIKQRTGKQHAGSEPPVEAFESQVDQLVWKSFGFASEVNFD